MAAKIDQAKMQAGRLRKQQEREDEQRRLEEAEAEKRRQREEAEAEQARQEAVADAERKERQRQQEEAAIERQRQEAETAELRKQHRDLASMVASTYNEMDKINKKSPRLPVTELGLNLVNDAITDVKKFVTDDRFLDRNFDIRSCR